MEYFLKWWLFSAQIKIVSYSQILDYAKNI